MKKGKFTLFVVGNLKWLMRPKWLARTTLCLPSKVTYVINTFATSSHSFKRLLLSTLISYFLNISWPFLRDLWNLSLIASLLILPSHGISILALGLWIALDIESIFKEKCNLSNSLLLQYIIGGQSLCTPK